MAIKINGVTVISDTQQITSNSTASVSGNITGGNLLTGGLASVGGSITAGNILPIANVTYNLGSATQRWNDLYLANSTIYIGNSQISANATSLILTNPAGGQTVLAGASPGVTGNTVSASGNITGGNVLTGGLISATGNVTGGNIVTAAAVSAASVSTSGNITGGNLITSAAVSAGSVSASGNVTGGNLSVGTGNISGGNISLTGNSIPGNLLTGGIVSATGNVTGGNVIGTTAVVVPTVRNTAALTISTSSGDLNLQPTGNVVVNSKYINGVTDPVQDQDVATKKYVDNVATTGIAYHTPVTAATTANLATTTGGTITYTQPNGAGNGIGAVLTTTGSFNLIDTANVQTVGTRILVKNEANAVYNGVYTWANATNIVRSTDTDEYGPDSTIALSINDYFYTSGGNVNAGTAFIVNAPTGTITFGTSNITFSTFSSSQVYTANTAAGISLNGTVINAKVDGTTTAFDGTGNISVKASANLTTPNIGAATGTSLSVTGNVTAGNLNTAGLSLSSNVISALNSTSNITTTANISGGNIITGGALSAGSLSLSGASQAASYSASGNVTGGNILTGGLISSTGNITGGNILGGANVNATTHTGTTVSVTGSVTGSGFVATGATALTANVANVGMELGLLNGVNTPFIDFHSSGNATADYDTRIIASGGSAAGTGTLSVIGATLAAAGAFSAVGNITGGNLNAAGLSLSSNVVSALNVTANIAGGNITTSGLISATGNITGGNVLGGANVNATTHTGTTVSVTGNITGGNLNAAGLSLSSNVVSALNVTSNIAGGNITTPGLISATGNITGGNILGGANVNATTHTGTTVSVSGNITGGNLSVSTGTVTVGNIVNSNANGVGNIGSATTYFNTVFAKATSAQYADLAELYTADAEYEPGTVVEFGGIAEVTLSNKPNSTQVAGVVSTNPSYLMNATLQAEHVATVALQGRVPCKVIGPVSKGDLMVAAGGGYAKVDNLAKAGTIIGKALEVMHTPHGVIEVAVGRF